MIEYVTNLHHQVGDLTPRALSVLSDYTHKRWKSFKVFKNVMFLHCTHLPNRRESFLNQISEGARDRIRILCKTGTGMAHTLPSSLSPPPILQPSSNLNKQTNKPSLCSARRLKTM